jgi:membrane protein DedA with SNARE-associated domain
VPIDLPVGYTQGSDPHVTFPCPLPPRRSVRMIDWFERGSYLGIVLFLTLTGIGLPVPEEVPIVAAGVASRAGALQWYYALPACLLGALLGDSLMYAIGRCFGARILREHPWWAGFLTSEREQAIERLIQTHGIKAFFVARFLVGLRSPFYLTAGILRVKYRWFLLADSICASVVIGGFFGLSFAFGDRITGMIRSVEWGLTLVVLIVSLGSLAVIAFFWFRRRRMRMLDQDPESLFENRELIFGPAADRIPDTVMLGDGHRPAQERPSAEEKSTSGLRHGAGRDV